ncbi:hypothetical protein MA126_004777 [Escherichia coli]|nr:hypothetical protein [Escherichia coli]
MGVVAGSFHQAAFLGARRYYNALINMFYQDEEMWGAFVLWLELHGKPDLAQGWKALLKPPYSESLKSSYFMLTDTVKLFEDELSLLLGFDHEANRPIRGCRTEVR